MRAIKGYKVAITLGRPPPGYPRNYMKYSRKPTFLGQRLSVRNGQNQTILYLTEALKNLVHHRSRILFLVRQPSPIPSNVFCVAGNSTGQWRLFVNFKIYVVDSVVPQTKNYDQLKVQARGNWFEIT